MKVINYLLIGHNFELQRKCEMFYEKCDLCNSRFHPSQQHLCPMEIIKCEHSECLWVGKRIKQNILFCPVDRLKRIHKNIVNELRRENETLRRLTRPNYNAENDDFERLSRLSFDEGEETCGLFTYFET